MTTTKSLILAGLTVLALSGGTAMAQTLTEPSSLPAAQTTKATQSQDTNDGAFDRVFDGSKAGNAQHGQGDRDLMDINAYPGSNG